MVIDHLSLNVHLKPNTGHRSYEHWEYGNKLFKNKHCEEDFRCGENNESPSTEEIWKQYGEVFRSFQKHK